MAKHRNETTENEVAHMGIVLLLILGVVAYFFTVYALGASKWLGWIVGIVVALPGMLLIAKWQVNLDACATCGNRIARRVLPFTADAQWSSAGTHITWQEQRICVRCIPVQCMVKGCTTSATEVFEHRFQFGDRSTTNVPNDVWACKKHSRAIKLTNNLKGIGGLLILSGIAVGVMLVWWGPVWKFPGPIVGPAEWQIPSAVLDYAIYSILCCIPGIALTSYGNSISPSKKFEFATRIWKRSDTDWG